MIRHLGSSLTDVTYVFDEPSIGLHPHDIQRMNRLLLRLRDKGNTVLVVEHKPEVIAIADHVVDLGPGAGTDGGQIMFTGDVADLRASDTVTGRHLDDRARLKPTVRTPTGSLEIRGADAHNLDDVDVDIPLGVLVVVTGVAGSGKSSLIEGSLSVLDGVETVDQAPIRGSRRSNPPRTPGCSNRSGRRSRRPTVSSRRCSARTPKARARPARGRRHLHRPGDHGRRQHPAKTARVAASPDVLQYTFGGRNIADVLELPVADALDFFAAGDAKLPAAQRILARLDDVGLGYLTLGQPRRRCPAVNASASNSPPTWAPRAASSCSTSRPPACTWPTSPPAGAARSAGRRRHVGDRDRASPGRDGPCRLDRRPRSRRRTRRRAHRLRRHPG